MPVLGGGGFGMPIDWDDPGDTGYKYGGPGTGRGGTSGPGALAIGAGAYGGGAGSSGALPFGQNPLFRRRMMARGRGGVAPSGPQAQYGGPGIDPSQFSGSTMMGAGGGQAMGGPKAGAGPQANFSIADLIRRGGGPSGGGDMPFRPPGLPPGGPAAPAPGPGPAPFDPVDWQRRYLEGRGNQHDWTNLAQFLAAGGTIPGTVFSPEGTAAGQEMRRQRGLQTSDAMNRRANLLAQSNPNLDQSQRGFGNFLSGINTAGGIARGNQDAVNQNIGLYEDMIRQMTAAAQGYNYDRGMSEFNNQWQQRLQPPGGSGIPGMIGQIGGSAIGAWLGGPAAVPIR